MKAVVLFVFTRRPAFTDSSKPVVINTNIFKYILDKSLCTTFIEKKSCLHDAQYQYFALYLLFMVIKTKDKMHIFENPLKFQIMSYVENVVFAIQQI